MVQDDIVCLNHILDGIKFIDKYCKKLTFNEFSNHELLQSAVIRQLEIIGEASNMVSKATKRDIPEIEWRKIISMRNKLIHAYFGVDWNVVWTTIEISLPQLKKAIRKYLK